jgi:hypothetical protein
MKKGIVLKCQGNPVSCYGKRSAEIQNEKLLEEEQRLSIFNQSSREDKILFQLFNELSKNCDLGNKRSCERLFMLLQHNIKKA